MSRAESKLRCAVVQLSKISVTREKFEVMSFGGHVQDAVNQNSVTVISISLRCNFISFCSPVFS